MTQDSRRAISSTPSTKRFRIDGSGPDEFDTAIARKLGLLMSIDGPKQRVLSSLD
jgi:hypothetical protein